MNLTKMVLSVYKLQARLIHGIRSHIMVTLVGGLSSERRDDIPFLDLDAGDHDVFIYENLSSCNLTFVYFSTFIVIILQYKVENRLA